MLQPIDGHRPYKIYNKVVLSLNLFDRPFDKLTVPSNVEGLKALSNIEGPRILEHFLLTRSPEPVPCSSLLRRMDRLSRMVELS